MFPRDVTVYTFIMTCDCVLLKQNLKQIRTVEVLKNRESLSETVVLESTPQRNRSPITGWREKICRVGSEVIAIWGEPILQILLLVQQSSENIQDLLKLSDIFCLTASRNRCRLRSASARRQRIYPLSCSRRSSQVFTSHIFRILDVHGSVWCSVAIRQ